MPAKASKKQVAVLPDLKLFTVQQLEKLIDQAKQLIYPVARICKGKIVCRKCRRWSVPNLVETGYIATHDLQTLSNTEITARGWSDSSCVNEEGDQMLLECTHCYQLHQIPDGVEINWQ